MFLFLVAVLVLSHNDEFLFLRKHEGIGCLGNYTQLEITELDHCVPTIVPLTGQRIFVRYNWEESHIEAQQYLFLSNCRDREISITTKDLEADGVTCVDDYFVYEVVDADKAETFFPTEFGAYIEMHEEQGCLGEIFRWEFYKGWGGYCDGEHEDRCEDRDEYSVLVDCSKADLRILEIEKELEFERKQYLAKLAIGTLIIVMVILMCFVFALALVGLGICLVKFRTKLKPEWETGERKKTIKFYQEEEEGEEETENLDFDEDEDEEEDEPFSTDDISLDDELDETFESTTGSSDLDLESEELDLDKLEEGL